MPTASISLVREQTEAVRPPRALWVPFALGRPLGSAVDPEFQKDVLRAALAMLDTATERTISDHDVAIPDEAGPGQWACPLNLGQAVDDTFAARLASEVDRLRPWAEETRRARGRSLFGITGAAPDQVGEVATALGTIADTGDLSSPPTTEVDWAFEMPLLARHLTDDLRTFYHEAIAAQPGASAPNHDALNEWIFGGTALGDTLIAIGDHLTADGSAFAMLVRGLTVPEGHYKGGSAFPATKDFGISES